MTDDDARLDRLKSLIARMPEDETLRFTLGRLLAEAGAHAEAAAAFEEAVRLKPDFSAAWLALGKSLQKDGRPEEARRAFQDGLDAAAGAKDEMTAKALAALLKTLPPPPA